MSRSVFPVLALVACAGGDELSKGEVEDIAGQLVDEAIVVHEEKTDVHGGPFATAADIDAAIGAHDANESAHDGMFATPGDLASTVSNHNADPSAHTGLFATPEAVVAAIDGHDSDPSAHAGLFPSEADVLDLVSAHDTDPSAHANLALDVGQLPVRTHAVALPLFSMLLGGGATFNAGGFGNTGALLPDTGSPTIAASFVVPEEFEGTGFDIDVTWRINATGCTVNLSPNFVDRGRDGAATTSGSVIAGFTGPVVPLTAPATLRAAEVSTYRLTSGGGFVDIQPGDTLAFGLYRSSGAVNDTCAASLSIAGISARWDGR